MGSAATMRLDPRASLGLAFAERIGEEPDDGQGHITELVVAAKRRYAIYTPYWSPNAGSRETLVDWNGARWQETAEKGVLDIHHSLWITRYDTGALLFRTDDDEKSTPRFRVLDSTAPAPAWPRNVRAVPIALQATKSGSVVLLAREGTSASTASPAIVMIWGPHAASPVRVEVPQAMPAPTLLRVSDRRVLVGDGQLVMALDDHQWASLPAPTEGYDDVVLTERGELWLTLHERLFHATEGGALEEMRVAPLGAVGPMDPSALYDSGDAVWFVVRWDGEEMFHEHCAVFRSPPRTEAPIVLPSRLDAKAFLNEEAPWLPQEPWGSQTVVALESAPSSSNGDYDYPATRAALRGHPELAAIELVEVNREGRRTLVARVDSVDVAKALLERMHKAIPAARVRRRRGRPRPSQVRRGLRDRRAEEGRRRGAAPRHRRAPLSVALLRAVRAGSADVGQRPPNHSRGCTHPSAPAEDRRPCPIASRRIAPSLLSLAFCG